MEPKSVWRRPLSGTNSCVRENRPHNQFSYPDPAEMGEKSRAARVPQPSPRPFFLPLGLRIEVVRSPEPALHVVVNIHERADGDAVGNAVAFGEPARVDQSPGGFRPPERETQINPRQRGWLNLSKDVLAIQRHE